MDGDFLVLDRVANALGEHVPTWISVVIEEMLRDENLDFKVTLAS